MTDTRLYKNDEGEEIEVGSCEDCPALILKHYRFGTRQICGLKKMDLDFDGIKPEETYPDFQTWCPLKKIEGA